MCSASFLQSSPCSVPWDASIWSDSLTMRNDSAIYKNIITPPLTTMSLYIHFWVTYLFSSAALLLYVSTVSDNAWKNSRTPCNVHIFNMKQIFSRNFGWQTVSFLSKVAVTYPLFSPRAVLFLVLQTSSSQHLLPVVTRSCKTQLLTPSRGANNSGSEDDGLLEARSAFRACLC